MFPSDGKRDGNHPRQSIGQARLAFQLLQGFQAGSCQSVMPTPLRKALSLKSQRKAWEQARHWTKGFAFLPRETKRTESFGPRGWRSLAAREAAGLDAAPWSRSRQSGALPGATSYGILSWGPMVGFPFEPSKRQPVKRHHIHPPFQEGEFSNSQVNGPGIENFSQRGGRGREQ